MKKIWLALVIVVLVSDLVIGQEKEDERFDKQIIGKVLQHLVPLADELQKKIDGLIKDLDNDSYQIRESATKELIKLGVIVVDELKKAHDKPKSIEVKYRAKKILKDLAPLIEKRDKLVKELQSNEWYFIELLKFDEPWIRQGAIKRLKELTKKDFGFKPDASKAEREKAIKKWKDWYKKEITTVHLPIASQAKKIEKKKDKVIAINVLKKGNFCIGEKTYTKDGLGKLLKTEYENSPKEDIGIKGLKFSKIWVLIKADKDVKYKYVMDVMRGCCNARIYKLSFAASIKDKKIEGRIDYFLPTSLGVICPGFNRPIDIDEVRIIVFKPSGKEKQLVVRLGGGRGRRGACHIPNLPGTSKDSGPRVNEPLLVAKLKELKAGYTGKKEGGLPVIIDGKEGECEFKHIMNVLNACITAGIKNITFAAKEIDW